MLSLSVVHHIDNYSAEKKKMTQTGPQRLKATMEMLSDLLKLAWVHIIELPDRPWLDHVHEAFEGNPQAILEAVGKRTGFQWEMKKIYENAWIGHRELWLLRRTGEKTPTQAKTDSDGIAAFFPSVLPSTDPEFEEWMKENASVIDATPRPLGERRQSRQETLGNKINAEDKLVIDNAPGFLQDVLLGEWMNDYGEEIDLWKGTTEEPKAWAIYATRGRHPITWQADTDGTGGNWRLTNHGGVFLLEAASKAALVWTRHGSDPFTTCWQRRSE